MKTSELTGPALDYAVAVANRRGPAYNHYSFGGTWSGWWLTEGGEYERLPRYSTEWAQGGPIIDRMVRGHFFLIADDLHPIDADRIHVAYGATEHQNFQGHGPTLLIAAMRCYVASKLGDEVEIQEELK